MASKRRPGSGASRPKLASALRARPRADSSPDSLESELRAKRSPYNTAQPAHEAGHGLIKPSGARPGKPSRAEVEGLARTGTGLITDFSRALDDSLHRLEGLVGAAPSTAGAAAAAAAKDGDYSPHSDSGEDARGGHKRGPRGTSSRFRGVTRHRRTRRWEAHIWSDKKQIYLGGYDSEEHAGKAHDVMALKCRGADSPLNFAMDEYAELLPMLAKLSKARPRPGCPAAEEVVLLLRRQSKGFARDSSRARAAAKARAPPRPPAASGRQAAPALEPDTPAAADAPNEGIKWEAHATRSRRRAPANRPGSREALGGSRGAQALSALSDCDELLSDCEDVDMRSPLGALTVAAAAAAAAPDAAWRRSGTSSRRATPHGGATPALGTTRPALPPVQSHSPPEMLPEQLAWASMPTATLLDQLCAAHGAAARTPASGYMAPDDMLAFHGHAPRSQLPPHSPGHGGGIGGGLEALVAAGLESGAMSGSALGGSGSGAQAPSAVEALFPVPSALNGSQGDAPHWPWSQAGGAAGLGALNLPYLAPSQLAAALGYPATYPDTSSTPSGLSGAAWGVAAYYGEEGAAASGGPSGGGAGGPAEGVPTSGDRAASSSSDNCMFEAGASRGAHAGG